jgi:hypothetical protein
VVLVAYRAVDSRSVFRSVNISLCFRVLFQNLYSTPIGSWDLGRSLNSASTRVSSADSVCIFFFVGLVSPYQWTLHQVLELSRDFYNYGILVLASLGVVYISLIFYQYICCLYPSFPIFICQHLLLDFAPSDTTVSDVLIHC